MRDINFDTVAKIVTKLDPSLRVEDFQLKPRSKRVHYCSLMYAIEVNVIDKTENKVKLAMMIKTVPDNPLRVQYIQDGKYFIKEIETYDKIIPEIMKPVGFLEFPSIYDTFSSSKGDDYYIVMDDLTEKGYQTYLHIIDGLDENHTKFVIKKLAHLHAASFIKYKGDGIQMEMNYPDIKEHFWKTDLEKETVPDMNHVFMFNTYEQIRKLLKRKGLEHGISRVKKLMDVGHETLSKLGKMTRKYPSVFTHGDPWTTNFLFKYDDMTSNLVNMKFVDFQMSRITSRMTDLGYFLYTSVNSKLLNESLYTLLQLYFDTFNKICEDVGGMQVPLTYMGGDLTWEHFLDEWNYYKAYGQVSALLYIHIMYADPDNPADMENLEDTDFELRSDKTKGTFDNAWNYKPMQDVLFNLIFEHLPNIS